MVARRRVEVGDGSGRASGIKVMGGKEGWERGLKRLKGRGRYAEGGLAQREDNKG